MSKNRCKNRGDSKKIGFIGFLSGMIAVKNLYTSLKKYNLKFLMTYKISQDHIELFFGKVRSCGGCNNNPTARQFASAFKKLLIHNDIADVLRGNCIPLESIPILTVSTLKKGNNDKTSLCCTLIKEINNSDSVQSFPHSLNFDLDINSDINMLNAFQSNILFYNNVISYLAGFVARKIKSKLTCEDCCNVLEEDPEIINERAYLDFIKLKSKHSLTFPSKDVVNICISAEQHFKSNVDSSHIIGNVEVVKLVNLVAMSFIGQPVFEKLNEHIKQHDPLNNHATLLLRCIAASYIECRLYHALKLQTMQLVFNKSVTSRQVSNKLILFNGL